MHRILCDFYPKANSCSLFPTSLQVIILRSETLEIKRALFPTLSQAYSFSSETSAAVPHVALAETGADDITLRIYSSCFIPQSMLQSRRSESAQGQRLSPLSSSLAPFCQTMVSVRSVQSGVEPQVLHLSRGQSPSARWPPRSHAPLCPFLDVTTPGSSSARRGHVALTTVVTKVTLCGPPLPEPDHGCTDCTSLIDRERALFQSLGHWVSASVYCKILSGTYFPVVLLFVLSACAYSLHALSTVCG